MRLNAAKALAKGEEVSLPFLLSEMGVFGAKIDYVHQEGRDFYLLTPTRRISSCYEDAAVADGRFVAAIDWCDTITIDLCNDEPQAGQVAVAAYYDGWSHEVGLILFREGAKGLEGYNHAAGRWIPAERFRCLGVLVGFGINRGKESIAWWRNLDGLDFAALKPMRDEARRQTSTLEVAA